MLHAEQLSNIRFEFDNRLRLRLDFSRLSPSRIRSTCETEGVLRVFFATGRSIHRVFADLRWSLNDEDGRVQL